MAFELNLNAVRFAAQNTAANPLLTAKAAKAAKAANDSAKNQSGSAAKLAGLAALAGLAVSSGLLTTFSAPTDVGAAQAQIEPTKPQKVPAPWCDVGVVATPATSIDQAQKPQPAPAKKLSRFHLDQPWRIADRTYQHHHWNCPVCMAAARAAPGTASRCTEGQRLHDDYSAQAAAA